MRAAQRCTDVTNEVIGEADGADVLTEQAPPLRAAAERRRGLGQAAL